MSTVAGMPSQKTKLEKGDDPMKRMSIKRDEKQEIKFTFKPISLIDFGDEESMKTRRAELENLQPLSKGDKLIEINMRSLVSKDNEPQYFL